MCLVNVYCSIDIFIGVCESDNSVIRFNVVLIFDCVIFVMFISIRIFPIVF